MVDTGILKSIAADAVCSKGTSNTNLLKKPKEKKSLSCRHYVMCGSYGNEEKILYF